MKIGKLISIILGLRKVNGIDIDEFNKKFDVNIMDLYNISVLVLEGKLVVDGGYLRVSEEYFYTANEILISFV